MHQARVVASGYSSSNWIVSLTENDWTFSLCGVVSPRSLSWVWLSQWGCFGHKPPPTPLALVVVSIDSFSSICSASTVEAAYNFSLGYFKIEPHCAVLWTYVYTHTHIHVHVYVRIHEIRAFERTCRYTREIMYIHVRQTCTTFKSSCRGRRKQSENRDCEERMKPPRVDGDFRGCSMDYQKSSASRVGLNESPMS